VTAPESCNVCHGAGSFASATVAHAVPPVPTVSNVAFVEADPDLQITFNLKLDGVNATDFDSITARNGVQTAYRFDGDERSGLTAALSGGAAGDYTITIAGGFADAATPSRYVIRVANPAGTRAVVVGNYPSSPVVDVVSNAACVNCHSGVGQGIHMSYPMGAEQCVVCHKATNLDFGDSFVGIIHGLHAAHIMPSGNYTYVPPDPLDDPVVFDTTFPSYMNNCSLCHSEPAMLAAANSMTVSGANCFSCHGSMAAEAFENAPSFHAPYTEATDCASVCHNPTGTAPSFADVTDFHNGVETGNDGIIWDGVDTSVTEGERFTWQITGVVDDGTNLAISWTATYDGVGVNPCNATVGPGAPLFDGDDAGNLSMLRNYKQGDDFILGQASNPGQPTNVNLTTTNTVCAGNVATTTIPVEAVDATVTVGRVALQGKPRVVSVADPTATMQVRVPTPTYDWVLGTSDAATPRRDIVDTAGKCLKCHVGSLYQHGGNRVDNIDVCTQCHNSASNERYVRAEMGVDASEAYDGKVGQTYEMKTMLHAIHSASVTGPIVIYRGRGIYAFARDVDQLPNAAGWKAAVAGDPCTTPQGGTNGRLVFGADPALGVSCQDHNFHAPTYPRRLNDCYACHEEPTTDGAGNLLGFRSYLPDQSKAVATTVDPGESYTSQIDDVLQGASSAACTSCHKDSDTRAHSYQNGWVPTVFPEGRKTILDAAN